MQNSRRGQEGRQAGPAPATWACLECARGVREGAQPARLQALPWPVAGGIMGTSRYLNLSFLIYKMGFKIPSKVYWEHSRQHRQNPSAWQRLINDNNESYQHCQHPHRPDCPCFLSKGLEFHLWNIIHQYFFPISFYCYYYFFLFRAAPETYGGSQARGQIVAATQDPSSVCDLHHSSGQRQVLTPLSEARDQTRVLTDASRVCYH